MTDNKNLKQAADELMKQPGKIRGEAIIGRYKYIHTVKGESGVTLVEKKLKELGYPLSFKDLKSLGWYSDANATLLILAAKEVFGWSDNDIFAMGQYAPRVSFIVKLLMKYFVSMEMTFKASPQNWAKHHTVGSIEDVRFEKNKNEMRFKLKNYDHHPIICVYLRGYFSAFAGFIIKSPEIRVEEVKCTFRGDAYHEYGVTWR